MRRILEKKTVQKACTLFTKEQLQEQETMVEEERLAHGNLDFYESLQNKYLEIFI